MAKIVITEYPGVGMLPGGVATQAPIEPAIADQAVTYTTSTQSAVFNERTKLIRVVADAKAHINVSGNPTATANNRWVAANAPEFFWLGDGAAGLKLAAYDGTS